MQLGVGMLANRGTALGSIAGTDRDKNSALTPARTDLNGKPDPFQLPETSREQ